MLYEVITLGAQVDCMIKTSRPRTLSMISTRVSPSLKRETRALPRGMPRRRVTASANAGLALPVKTVILSTGTSGLPSVTYVARYGWGARIRTWECRNQNPVPYRLATPQCDRQTVSRFKQWVPVYSAGNESIKSGQSLRKNARNNFV